MGLLDYTQVLTVQNLLAENLLIALSVIMKKVHAILLQIMQARLVALAGI
jgi:hypothetical protein